MSIQITREVVTNATDAYRSVIVLDEDGQTWGGDVDTAASAIEDGAAEMLFGSEAINAALDLTSQVASGRSQAIDLAAEILTLLANKRSAWSTSS